MVLNVCHSILRKEKILKSKHELYIWSAEAFTVPAQGLLPVSRGMQHTFGIDSRAFQNCKQPQLICNTVESEWRQILYNYWYKYLLISCEQRFYNLFSIFDCERDNYITSCVCRPPSTLHIMIGTIDQWNSAILNPHFEPSSSWM